MSEPVCKKGSRQEWSAENKRMVSMLNKLLMKSELGDLLQFLHNMRIQFSLSTDGKGKYHCRVFQHWYDPEDSVRLLQVIEWHATGNSAQAAVCNSIGDLLASEGDDFHAFINRGWPDE